MNISATDPSELSADLESLLYRAAGQGVWSGILTAGLSHWLGLTNPLLMAFVFAFSLYSLRGWRELCAIMTMMGTTTLYFWIYDIIKLVTA